jgi:ABC-2 type transport system permease protein
MTGSIFMETLRRNWRLALYWGLGIGSYALLIILIIPDVDMLKQYADLLQNMPLAMLKMFGAGDSSAIATPEGFLSFVFFTYAMMMLAVYAVLAGLNITASEEDQGILDVVLSLPVPRSRVVVERLAVYVLFVILIVLLTFVGLWIGIQINASNPNGAFHIDAGKVLEGSLNLIPVTVLMVALTAFATALIRRKGLATGVAALVIIGCYLVDYVGAAATGTLVDQIRALSFFHYFDSSGVMQNGLSWGNIFLLLGLTAVLWIGSVWFFQRRDVGT